MPIADFFTFLPNDTRQRRCHLCFAIRARCACAKLSGSAWKAANTKVSPVFGAYLNMAISKGTTNMNILYIIK